MIKEGKNRKEIRPPKQERPADPKGQEPEVYKYLWIDEWDNAYAETNIDDSLIEGVKNGYITLIKFENGIFSIMNRKGSWDKQQEFFYQK